MAWPEGKNAWVDDVEAWARAGGRRHYNATRRLHATLRRIHVFHLWQRQVRQSEMARQLGVHPSTISRDITAIYRALQMHGVSVSEGIRRVPPRRQW